ncbi:MAG: hypothetical protein U1G05_13245 [Kiritimatiellia bacterium]
MKHLPALVLAALTPWTSFAETRILFSARTSDVAAFDLYVMSSTGTGLRRLADTATVSEWGAALSPDNFHVAYVDRNALTGNLYVGDLLGGAPARINIAGRVLAVDWIDANSLCYLLRNGTYDGDFTIRRVNADGTGDAAVYADIFHNYSTGGDTLTVHRPTGRVYFSSFFGSVTIRSGLLGGATPDRAYARGVDALAGGEFGVEGTTLYDHYDPCPSPDGTRIAYAADHGTGYHRIYTKNNDPAETDSVSRRGDVYCGDPAWSPDGTWIAFTRAATSTYGEGPYIGNIIRNSATGAAAESNLTSALAAIAGRCGQPAVYEAPACPSALEILSTTRIPAGTLLAWPATPGLVYQVSYSDDAMQTWNETLPASRLLAAAGETSLTYTDTTAAPAQRIYKLVVTCP